MNSRKSTGLTARQRRVQNAGNPIAPNPTTDDSVHPVSGIGDLRRISPSLTGSKRAEAIRPKKRAEPPREHNGPKPEESIQKSHTIASVPEVSTINARARSLWNKGDLAGARALFERILKIVEQTLGPKHLDTAAALTELAWLLTFQGNGADARPLLERALVIYENAPGFSHLIRASILVGLGDILITQGDFTGAQSHLDRALAIYEKTLESHDLTASINMARALRALADLFVAQDNLADARALLERALPILERTRTAQHFAVADAVGRLIMVLVKHGKLASARSYLERILAIHENTLGHEHPYTLAAVNGLAALHGKLGNFIGAQALRERAVAIFEKTHGSEHPNTATALNHLAITLKDKGDLASARPFFERALAIRERTLGVNHPHTAESLAHLNYLTNEGQKTQKPPHMLQKHPTNIADAFNRHFARLSMIHDSSIIIIDENLQILSSSPTIVTIYDVDSVIEFIQLTEEGRMNDPIEDLMKMVKDRPDLAIACLRFLEREITKPEYAKLSAELTEARQEKIRERERKNKARYRQRLRAAAGAKPSADL